VGLLSINITIIRLYWFDDSAIVDHASHCSGQVCTSREAKHPDFVVWVCIVFGNKLICFNALAGDVLGCNAIKDVAIKVSILSLNVCRGPG
jgi:hypothetical protein